MFSILFRSRGTAVIRKIKYLLEDLKEYWIYYLGMFLCTPIPICVIMYIVAVKTNGNQLWLIVSGYIYLFLMWLLYFILNKTRAI